MAKEGEEKKQTEFSGFALNYIKKCIPFLRVLIETKKEEVKDANKSFSKIGIFI